jgi:hypothetical protein
MSLEIETVTTFVPILKWYQSKDFIFINFEVFNSTDNGIYITDNNIIFNVLSNDKQYLMSFYLYNNIIVEDSKFSLEEKLVKMLLKKKDSESWIRLTKNRDVYKNNIQIDWNCWINDDSDDENEGRMSNQQFDFQQMMQSMGGMQNMEDMYGNMEGMESEEGIEDDNVQLEDDIDNSYCEECTNE